MSDKPPERIWLQWDWPSYDFRVTWCEDEQNESDIEYVRADEVATAEVAILREAAKRTCIDCIDGPPQPNGTGGFIHGSRRTRCHADGVHRMIAVLIDG